MLNKRNWKTKKDINTLVTHTNPQSVISEEFNTLRTNIQFAMANKPFQTIMITSAHEGEGKTTIATNTALAFVKQGKKILLVDADMRNPSIHKIFHTENRQGLTNLLTDKEVALADVLTPTSYPDLSIITSGLVPPNPSELIDSERMEEVIEMFKEEFQLIIFDMPPIVLVTDAQVMAAKVDGTVFVIRNGVTEKKELIKAQELLEYAKATVVGAVLNDKKSKSRGKYGIYGYDAR